MKFDNPDKIIPMFTPGKHLLVFAPEGIAGLDPKSNYSISIYLNTKFAITSLHPANQVTVSTDDADQTSIIDNKYILMYTLRECHDTCELVFEANSGDSSLGKHDCDGMQRDDFALSIKRFAALYHKWIDLKARDGRDYPTACLVDITNPTRWVCKFSAS